MWCHLSALAGLVVPFGNLLGPLIVWQMKRQEFPSVNEHGKESFNFQLSILLYMMAGGVLALVGAMLCVGLLLLPILIPALIVLHFGALVLAVVAGIKANEGTTYRYPINLRLI